MLKNDELVSNYLNIREDLFYLQCSQNDWFKYLQVLILNGSIAFFKSSDAFP